MAKDIVDELKNEMETRKFAMELSNIRLSNLLVRHKVVDDYIAFSKFLDKKSLANIFVAYVMQEKHNRSIYRGK